MLESHYPDTDHEFTLSNGICVSFGHESCIHFYDEEDELLFTLDPADMSVIYAAYRMMVKEKLEERALFDEEETFI